ncbi:MAG TPA: lmo0937 family membrane protein [Flavisolibacter sp.]|nr:lmo0937 family membrane protein [Flavisolibacter sp.]
MRSLLYLISVLLIVGWLLGVFYWNVGGMIHILIILAVISLLFGLIRKVG